MQTGNEQGEQISFFDQDLWFSKMSKACFPQTGGQISDVSSKKPQELSTVTPLFLDLRTDRLGLIPEPLWETSGLSLGVYMTHSFGASPNVAVVSRLSQILEDRPHPKYCLSAKACQGILRRSQNRGKELPPILKQALEEQVTRSKFGGGCEIDSHGKRAGKGALVQEELSGTLSVSDPQTLITYAIDRAAFNQGENAKYDFSVEEEIAQPIVARGAGGVMTSSEVYKQETTKE